VIDHFSQFRIWNSPVDFDRVPMLLVHVIARLDLLVSIAQFERKIGIAF